MRTIVKAAARLVLLSAVLVAAGVSQAAQIFYTDRAAFQAAAGALATEAFNTQHVAAQEVDFGPFLARAEWASVFWANAASLPDFVSEGAGSIYGFDTQPAGIGNGIAFTFDEPIREFGIDILELTSGIYAQAPGLFLENPVLGPTATASPVFFGVISDEAFSQIIFHWGSAQDGVGMDYLQYTVPEPASLALLALGMLALARLRHRV